ncbi:ABC-three component system protein [Vibrio alginolyticus]
MEENLRGESSSDSSVHSATGPALGYYYQSVYALTLLFDSTNDKAFVSVETWDDVELCDGASKELHQLKHSIDAEKKISVASREFWSTINVWVDFISKHSLSQGLFVLVTVADIKEDSPLKVLSDTSSDRSILVEEMRKEAKKVIDARKEVELDNQQRIKNSQKPNSLPYENKYKGCKSFLDMSNPDQVKLVNNISHKKGAFQIHEGRKEVEKVISTLYPEYIRTELAKLILSWWDREVIESLTGERARAIYAEELKQFIAEKAAILIDDGLTDDSDILNDIFPEPNLTPMLEKQLDLINATDSQKRRSAVTEMKARNQRRQWIERRLSLATKITQYDSRLVSEWKDLFEEVTEDIEQEAQKVEVGKKLLKWSHFEAHNEVPPIRYGWTNPDLVRGSYQILSAKKSVGWHPDYMERITDED